MYKLLSLVMLQVLLGPLASRFLVAEPCDAKRNALLTVEYLGHTSFLMTSQSGSRVLTDPYLDGFGLPFPELLSVDLVAVSAEGSDHDAVHQLRGNPVVLNENRLSGSAGDFQVESFPIGAAPGDGSVVRHGYVIRHGEIKMVFLGEIDQMLPEEILGKVDGADVVLVGLPLGGPVLEQLANRPNVRTLVPVSVTSPGSSVQRQGSILNGREQPEAERLEVTARPPKQIVRLVARASAMTPAVPERSVWKDTMVEMTWPQVQQASAEGALVLVPVGVIEQHGPHMGLGADTYLAYLHCLRIKMALAAAGTKALIAPPLFWGVVDDTRLPGSFNVRPETMTALITDICRSLQSWGFRRLVFVNEHGNRNHRRTLKDSLAKIREELNIETYSLDSMLTGVPVYQPSPTAGRYSPDYHAGAAETGVMAAEFPSEVDTRLAPRLKPQSNFAPLGYVGDPASYREETALSDYYLKGPQFDARRILTFFKKQPAKDADNETGREVGAEFDRKARALMDRYVEAAGGEKRLQAIRSHSRGGKLLDEGREVPLCGVWADGKWWLKLARTPDFTERFGFNGSYGWHIERGDVGQLPEPLVMLISLVLDPSLPLHLTAQLAKLAAPREEQTGDRSLIVVEGELKSGGKAVLTFDATTGLLVKFNQTLFEDYREVDGILFPFVIKARPGTEARFDSMENNIAFEPRDFEPPS